MLYHVCRHFGGLSRRELGSVTDILMVPLFSSIRISAK